MSITEKRLQHLLTLADRAEGAASALRSAVEDVLGDMREAAVDATSPATTARGPTVMLNGTGVPKSGRIWIEPVVVGWDDLPTSFAISLPASDDDMPPGALVASCQVNA